MKKLFAVVLVLSMLFALASCGGSNEPESTTVEETSEIISETETTEATEVSETESTTLEDTTEATTEEESTSAEETTTEETTEASKVPSTKEEIIAAYTEVMNQAKKDAPGYTKIEWQELPDDAESRQVSKGKTLVSIALKAANSFMTTKEDAEKNENKVKPKGNDMHEWPVCNTPVGSMLTEADAKNVKSAKCEVLPNGNYKITIVLNDERNPEPAAEGSTSSPSVTGKVFSPLSKKDIDDTLTNNTIVTTIASDITYSLLYHDCTAVLVYNPENNHVVSLDQYMNVAITGQGKVTGMQLVIDKQELKNTMKIYDVKY